MIVGRSGELRQLAAAWTRVVTTPHRSGTVVVTGAAGTGKSLLVATALDRFVPRPRVVLSGTARVHSPAPYDWLAAVLSADLGVSAQTWEPGVPADALAWLAQMPIPHFPGPQSDVPLPRPFLSRRGFAGRRYESRDSGPCVLGTSVPAGQGWNGRVFKYAHRRGKRRTATGRGI
ncbi:MAG TPA: ATP-binding protein [Micromonosporaceae bacterium]